MKSILLGVVASVILCGCSSVRVLDATVMSSKNMDIKKSLHRVDTNIRAIGKDVRIMYVLGLQEMPNIKEAMDNAIEQYPGCVGLADVSVTFNERAYPLILHERAYVVEGNPIYEVKK